MGIETLLQIEVLAAFGAFTAAIMAAIVWYVLKSKGLSRTNRLNLIVSLLLLTIIAGVMTLLLFNAVVYGDAYGIGWRDRGRLHSIAEEPASYWILLVVYYIAAVAALSLALVVAVRIVRSARR